MSWSTYVKATPAAEFEAAIDAVQIEHYTGVEESVVAAQNEQLDAAKAAAKALFQSGVVGPATDGSWYAVNFAGHGSPGHQLREGYATESVSVSVSQAIPPRE